VGGGCCFSRRQTESRKRKDEKRAAVYREIIVMTAVADAAHLYDPSIVFFSLFFFLSVSAFVDLPFARYNRLGAKLFSLHHLLRMDTKSWVNKLVRDDNK
jgi:uncharacterized membrane protein